jgi:hypothetical protein
MDVFALQEELDSVRVQRRTRREDRPPARKGPAVAGGEAAVDEVDGPGGPELVGMSSFASPATEPGSPQLITDSFALPASIISESEIIACLHPLSAEYSLRAKYTLLSHHIIGKGAYGEVVVGRLKEYQPVSSSGMSNVGASSSASFGSSSPLRKTNSFTAERSQLFAIKRIDKRCINPKSLSQLYGEVETLSLLSHSNVVRLQDVFKMMTFSGS